MPDPCNAQRSKVASLEAQLAELRADEVGATGAALHGFAAQIATTLRNLTQAQAALATCLKTAPVPPPAPPPAPPPKPPVPTPAPAPPADPLAVCAGLRMQRIALEQNIADLHADEVGATGAVLHGLAAQLAALQQQLTRLRGIQCRTIQVHFKSLLNVDDALTTYINQQFNAMHSLYATGRIDVLRGTTEDLSGATSLQHLLAFNVGKCQLAQTLTSDQTELFANRKNIPGGDLVIYIVTTLISSAGNALGCCVLPTGPPAAVIVRSPAAPGFPATWLAAHEIGHALGLIHVAGSDNLMFRNVGWTNTPPDLSTTEFQTMRNNDLTSAF